MARTRKAASTLGIVAYVRVSTDEQVLSGAGLTAQLDAIVAEATRRVLPVLSIHSDEGLSGKSLARRPALTAALADLDDGRGTILMVSKLDRLSRSVHDATGLLLRADRAGWGLVALDVAVDTTTPQGAAMTQVLAVFAELERKLIGQRTRDALAVKRSQGVRLGRPSTLPATVVDRIVTEHRDGGSWSAIARGLNGDQVPTAQGGARWHPATVRAVYRGQDATALLTG